MQSFKQVAVETLKSALISVLFSLVGVLLFAFIVKICLLSGEWIAPISRLIQGAAVALGVAAFVKGEKGLIKGGLSGLISGVLCLLLFSFIAGKTGVELADVLSVLYAAVVGVITGIVAVNVKKEG